MEDGGNSIKKAKSMKARLDGKYLYLPFNFAIFCFALRKITLKKEKKIKNNNKRKISGKIKDWKHVLQNLPPISFAECRTQKEAFLEVHQQIPLAWSTI